MQKEGKKKIKISLAGKGLIDVRPWYGKKGFSLLELLVVLFIMGLSISLVAPAMMGGVDKLRLNTASRELSASLRYARSLAVSLGKKQAVNIDIDTGGYWLNDDMANMHYLPSDVHFRSLTVQGQEVTVGKGAIVFYPNGNTSGGIVSITAGPNRSRQIRPRLITGIVEVCSGE